MTNSVRYFSWRDGRPRWQPGPKLRRAGFKGRDLKSTSGAWLPRPEALAAAERLNLEADAALRAGVTPTPFRRSPKRVARSGEALWDAYRLSPVYARLARKTQTDYASKAAIFLGEFGRHPIAAIAKPHVYRWWEELYEARGHAMANGTIAVVRLLLSYATRIGWREDNPALHLGLEGVAPRCIVWTPSEIEALMAAADQLDLSGVGDAIVIALATAQRQGDILALELDQLAGGRCFFRQGKTGARVAVPHTDALALRLESIRARRAASEIIDLQLARRVVLDQNRPYTGDRFRKHWTRVRAAAAKQVPGVVDKMFLDLRDTAITRLALAGCTVAEIRAISGHSLETVHQILKHYLALDDRQAASAIERLRSWMAAEGIAV